jgi:membrane-bound serine protease (ClpP class)
MIALLVGFALLVLLPHPWNGVGFVAASAWAIVGVLLGLRWSQRRPPLVGADVLVGQHAVVAALTPSLLVRVHGETWRALSGATVQRGDRVRVCSVDGLTLRVEPAEARPAPGRRSKPS